MTLKLKIGVPPSKANNFKPYREQVPWGKGEKNFF